MESCACMYSLCNISYLAMTTRACHKIPHTNWNRNYTHLYQNSTVPREFLISGSQPDKVCYLISVSLLCILSTPYPLVGELPTSQLIGRLYMQAHAWNQPKLPPNSLQVRETLSIHTPLNCEGKLAVLLNLVNGSTQQRVAANNKDCVVLCY